jgi:iron complex outermembrane receptor protein
VDWDFDAGSFVTDLRIGYLMAHERQTSAVQPLCDDAGLSTEVNGTEPEWRVNGQFGWLSTANWSATLTMRYIAETDDLVGGYADGTCEAQTRLGSVDSYFELGLRGTYTFGANDNAVLAAGIINLTDEEPPWSEVVSGGWPWHDQELYDIRGMRYYMNFTYDFF